MKIIRLLSFALGALLVATSAQTQGKLNVIATTEDLAAIAREVGATERIHEWLKTD
jgi:hypothetical protein